MTRGYERVVVDTYAWVELFAGSEKGKAVKRVLSEAEELYTPDIVLAELARKYAREGLREDVIRARLKLIERLSTLVSINVEIASLVARAYQRLVENSRRRGLKAKPSLADAVILAIAWHLRARVLTGDKHFERLDENNMDRMMHV